MLQNTVRIFDLDGSLTKQEALLKDFNPKIINLRRIGPGLRLWSSKKNGQEFKGHLDKGLSNTVTFLGSGDFHHLSGMLIEQINEPVSVIIFDNHPDWDMFSPRRSCGAWVCGLLELPCVKKVIIMGVASNDLDTHSIHSACLKSLRNNWLEIYPYQHKPTRVFLRRIPDNKSIEVEKSIFKSVIKWHNLKDADLAGVFSSLVKSIPTDKVYISIDKDCLRSESSLTNWEEGYLSLDELLKCIKIIKDNLDIAGIDICGDYSVPETNGFIKRIISHLDHPRCFTARRKKTEEINSVNQQANIRIIKELIY